MLLAFRRDEDSPLVNAVAGPDRLVVLALLAVLANRRDRRH